MKAGTDRWAGEHNPINISGFVKKAFSLQAFRNKNIRSRLHPLLCLLILFNRPFDKQTRRRV
jgi:hypothetical protein